MHDIYGIARSSHIEHGEFMKNEGAVYQLQDKEELMELTLSDLAEGFREKFKAHPAFLDASTRVDASKKAGCALNFSRNPSAKSLRVSSINSSLS